MNRKSQKAVIAVRIIVTGIYSDKNIISTDILQTSKIALECSFRGNDARARAVFLVRENLEGKWKTNTDTPLLSRVQFRPLVACDFYVISPTSNTKCSRFVENIENTVIDGKSLRIYNYNRERTKTVEPLYELPIVSLFIGKLLTRFFVTLLYYFKSKIVPLLL